MVSPKPLSDFVPDVTLIAFSIPVALAAAEHFPHANRFSLRVKEMVLILDIDSEFRRKPEFALADGAARGFRRLFADVQSMAASKLANPLTNRGFLVFPGSPATRPAGLTARLD
jgi:hypothetical protein